MLVILFHDFFGNILPLNGVEQLNGQGIFGTFQEVDIIEDFQVEWTETVGVLCACDDGVATIRRREGEGYIGDDLLFVFAGRCVGIVEDVDIPGQVKYGQTIIYRGSGCFNAILIF